MSTITNLESFLTNQFGDRYLYNVNRNVFDRTGSDAFYRTFLAANLFNEYQLNVIIGTDSGIFPRYIAKSGVPTGARYIFVELPAVLDALKRESLLDELPDEIAVVTPDLLMEQAERFQLTEYIFLDAVRVQESAGSSDGNLPEYREIAWSANQEVSLAKQKAWGNTYSSVFILRQLENLPENQVRFVDTLAGQFEGKTAVVLAGGPSMKQALPWVKQNRDRLVVIAVSRIARLLREEGVVPHLIVSVDPQKVSFEVSREMLLYAGEPEVPVFVCSNHASPLLVSQWPGRSLYYGQLLPWQSPLNADTRIYNGPTVSNVSFALAMHMGCKTILFAGVDLCYDAGGRTHAPGSNESMVGPDLTSLTPQVETYGGRLADTNIGYAESLEMLGLQAKLAVQLGCALYNSSLDAAKIPLIEYRPLEEIPLPEWEETASRIIERRVPESGSAARLSHYRRIKKELERARNKFQIILNLAREALGCTDGLFGRNGMERDFRHKIRMDKIERRLDASLKDFSILVKRFGLKKFLTILRTPKKAEDWSDEQIETATREYYEAYLEGTQYLIALIEETLQRVEARLEEEKAQPDFRKLSGQWERDGQFGRLAVWKERRPDWAQLLPAAERETAERLEEKFQRLLTEERTAQLSILKADRDVRHTRSKALLLFRRKALPDLQAMAQGLAGHPDQEKALPYLHFVEGLLAELRNEPDVAAASYDLLLTDPPHALTEDALLQVANLSIAANDAASALLAIECLAGISASYLPPYGEILKLVGRFDEAFHAYNRYLGLVPDDVAAMLRLGMLCREAQLNDAALELFNRALSKDPMNAAAQKMIGELSGAASQLSAR